MFLKSRAGSALILPNEATGTASRSITGTISPGPTMTTSQRRLESTRFWGSISSSRGMWIRRRGITVWKPLGPLIGVGFV